jgi:protein phosphatase
MANEVELIIGAATDVGRERQVNEDSHGFVHCAAGDLLIVCDGMGGHAAGDLASRTARDAIAAYCATYAASIGPRELLERAILHAHESVRSVAAQSQANAGMGTTCVLTLVRGNQAWVANVGDSRCYLMRGGHLRQLSVDHTKARKLLDAGIITADQFANHPEKGVLAQALGQRAVPQPFVSEAIALVIDDYFVLCSDGVYDSTERDMCDLTSANNPNYAAHNLAIEAVKRDGKDNATVVIGRYVNMNRATAAVVAAAVPVDQAAPIKPAIPWKNPQLLGVLAGVLALGAGIGWMLGGKADKVEPVTAAEGEQKKLPVEGQSESAPADPVGAPQELAVPKVEAVGGQAGSGEGGGRAANRNQAESDKATERDKKAAAPVDKGPSAKSTHTGGGGAQPEAKKASAAVSQPSAAPANTGPKPLVDKGKTPEQAGGAAASPKPALPPKDEPKSDPAPTAGPEKKEVPAEPAK